MSRRPRIPDVIALLAVALIAGIAILLAPSPRSDLTIAAEPGCDLHRASCSARLADGGRIDLSILPRPIPLLTPLQVEVRLAGMAATRVELDLTGADMAMGPNRTRLTLSAPGIYRGTATLPVCVTGKMKWQATVSIETGSGQVAVPFSFYSG